MASDPTQAQLRVLLVAAAETVRTDVFRALDGLPVRSRLTRAASVTAALEPHPGLAPDLILLDAPGPDFAADALVIQLGHLYPGKPVVLLVEPDDVPVAQQALLAGARGFCLKPVTTAGLRSVLDLPPGGDEAPPPASLGPGAPPAQESAPALHAAAPPPLGEPGRVTVFCAAEPRAGVSTAAHNVACALREATAAPVALVDMSGSGAAGSTDEDGASADAADARQALEAALSPEDEGQAGEGWVDRLWSRVGTTPQGVSLVRLPPRGVEGAQGGEFSAAATTRLLESLRERFPHVIVDLGTVGPAAQSSPEGDAGSAACLQLADHIIVTLLPQLDSLRHTAALLLALPRLHVDPARAWLSLNRVGMPGGIAPDAIREAADLVFVAHLPDDAPACEDAAANGVPVLVHRPGGALAAAFRDLAEQAMRGVPAYKLPARLAAAYTAATLSLEDEMYGVPPAGPGHRLSRALRTRQGRVAIVAAVVVILAGLAGALLSGVLLPGQRDAVAQARRTSFSSPTPATETAAKPALASLVAPAAADTATATRGAVASVAPTLSSGAAVAAATHAATVPPSAATQAPPATAAPSATASPRAAPTATATPPPTVTASPTASPTAPSIATRAATAPPTVTPTRAATAPPTVTPTRTAARPTATRRAAPTRTPLPRASATPAVVAVPPALLGPAEGATGSGVITFTWQPSGPLPPGAAYEVIWWNSGENPGAGRGFAPATTATSLAANLDPLAAAGQFSGSQVFWTVLVVRTEPYVRLTSPQLGEVRSLFYQAGAAPPPPPR